MYFSTTFIAAITTGLGVDAISIACKPAPHRSLTIGWPRLLNRDPLQHLETMCK